MSEKPEAVKADIRNWWAANPMTYGSDHGKTTYIDKEGYIRNVELGSREFFERADQTFYEWTPQLHTPQARFGRIFNYDRFKGKRVLEVGCGMGCMAMNWALREARITAVDLNPVAVKQTRQRFATFGLKGEIQEADAEALPFPDESFDFVYSWGVLHHTPRTKQTINELHRVLKPHGSTGVMLYHRDSLLYRYGVKFVEGYLHLENLFLSPVELGARYSDAGRQEGNPHTWPVTRQEATDVLFDRFRNVKVETFGADVIPILDTWLPRFGALLPRAMTRACAKRWGWFLWIAADK